MGPDWEDHDLVFPNTGGKLLNFLPLLRSAGLPRIRFHDLRHTVATLLLLHGVHAKVVSQMLGHSSVAITLDPYSHVLPDMQRDAAVAMQLLSGKAPPLQCWEIASRLASNRDQAEKSWAGLCYTSLDARLCINLMA
jgi:hypothetical protein